MSCNTNYSSSKGYCERFHKHNAFYTCNNGNEIRCKPVKKVIPSRNLDSYSNGVKSCSTGVIDHMKKLQVSKPRKTTKSDLHFKSQCSAIDFCTRCGDSTEEKKDSFKTISNHALYNLSNDIETQVFVDQERIKKACEKKKLIRQFYKNENFKPSSAKILNEDYVKKNALDPIKEATEAKSSSEEARVSVIELSDSVEEIGFLDPEDDKNIKDLKDFRKDNYFECHSSKARVSSKGSVTSLNDHKCVYRFYLNDRLFPVPLNSDHQNRIRCVECLLPLETDANDTSINGTIQTKVKIDGEVQDLMLMLPVKKPLIIQERRNMGNEKQNDVVYFGVVKLNCNGDSIFNTTNPNDSLALRYQKGYKEYLKNEKYMYEKVEEDNVIFI